MIEPLVKSVEVPCDPEKAFAVFLDMSRWWPTGRFSTSAMGGRAVKALRVDAKRGGQIVEVGSDDREHLWGTIRTYDPCRYLKLDFHVPHPTEETPGFSTVEVRFTELGGDRTRVELEQSDWEALGEAAEMARGGYRQAWVAIFEGAYKAACGG